MNTQQTVQWLKHLLPGEPKLSQDSAGGAESGRHAKSAPEVSVSTATFAVDEAGQYAVATTSLGEIDCGLRMDDGTDVRVELLFMGADPWPVREIATAAGEVVATDPLSNSPMPGRVFADLLADSEVDGTKITTVHLLCVPPFIWEQGVPHLREEGTSQLTTITQLVPITPAELSWLQAHSSGNVAVATQELMEIFRAAQPNLLDLARDSVVGV